MTTGKFIFFIDTECQYNVLVRIITTFNRQKIPIREMQSHQKPANDQLRVMVSVEDTKERAMLLAKRLHREIDVIKVDVFEQLN